MTNQDTRDELEELQLVHDAHGELAGMHTRLNTIVELLVADRDTEAEELARSSWARCQEMRAVFMARPSNEYVAHVLESIEAAQDQSLVWLDLVRTKPPTWAEWRRGELASHSQI